MGCDIHIQAQRQENGAWVDVSGSFSQGPQPFDWRSYGMFGFLADVRNYSDIPPIAEQRGLPSDVKYDEASEYRLGEHSFSWLAVAELIGFDYDQSVEDRRVTMQTGPNSWNGGATAEPGGGEMTTYREFLGNAFFTDLDELQRIGAERIIFGFDS